MKVFQEHLLHLIAGLIIFSLAIFLYDYIGNFMRGFEAIGIALVLAFSYIIGRLSRQTWNRRHEGHTKPYMIHYSLEDLKKNRGQE